MIKARDGFTLVELMVTMVIMVILTVLAVAVTGNIQAQARDNEREQDVQAIARGLEQRYNQGNLKVTGFATKGAYPGANEVLHIDGWDRPGGLFTPVQVPGGYRTEAYPGTSDNSFTSPSKLQLGAYCVYDCWARTTDGQTYKQREIQLLQNEYAAESGGYKDMYMYTPLSSNGEACTDTGPEPYFCRKYNLYWISETDSTPMYGIPGLKMITSKHQQ